MLTQADSLKGKTLMATIGMFDGVHLGHRLIISELRRLASERGMECAVVTFNQHPQNVLRKQGTVPMLMTQEQRMTCLAEQNIDYVIAFDFTPELAQLTSRQFMRMLREQYGVRTLIMGYNHRFGHDRDIAFPQYVESGKYVGVEVVKAPEYLGEFAPVSSSIIRRLIDSGKVDVAADCMGQPFQLSGIVVHGFKNGHKIGFPTANIAGIDPTLIIPHNGAYAVRVHVRGKWWNGMANVGNRPTMHNGANISIEANIFDFDNDIYNQPITLQFIKFLRLEFKMVSIEELRHQLNKDREKARQILNSIK